MSLFIIFVTFYYFCHFFIRMSRVCVQRTRQIPSFSEKRNQSKQKKQNKTTKKDTKQQKQNEKQEFQGKPHFITPLPPKKTEDEQEQPPEKSE